MKKALAVMLAAMMFGAAMPAAAGIPNWYDKIIAAIMKIAPNPSIVNF